MLSCWFEVLEELLFAILASSQGGGCWCYLADAPADAKFLFEILDMMQMFLLVERRASFCYWGKFAGMRMLLLTRRYPA